MPVMVSVHGMYPDAFHLRNIFLMIVRSVHLNKACIPHAQYRSDNCEISSRCQGSIQLDLITTSCNSLTFSSNVAVNL